MTRFRKKSVAAPGVVEAYEFHNRVGTDTRPDWIIEAADRGEVTFHQPRSALGFLLIRTLEGEMRADAGDWIIQGVKGELYLCKPDIFEATYEPAE